MNREQLGLSPIVIRDVEEAMAGVDDFQEPPFYWEERQEIIKSKAIPMLLNSLSESNDLDVVKRITKVFELISEDEIGIVFAPDREKSIEAHEVYTGYLHKSSVVIIFEDSVWDDFVGENMSAHIHSLREAMLSAYKKYDSFRAEGEFLPFSKARQKIL